MYFLELVAGSSHRRHRNAISGQKYEFILILMLYIVITELEVIE
jgi:hypothetical protein